MHPWLRLAWQHPERVAEHLAAYAELAADEAALALDHALARGRRQLLIAACGVVAATLAGTALLLWAALPAPAAGRVWWLLVVPLWPLAVAAMAWRWQPPAAVNPPPNGREAPGAPLSAGVSVARLVASRAALQQALQSRSAMPRLLERLTFELSCPRR